MKQEEEQNYELFCRGGSRANSRVDLNHVGTRDSQQLRVIMMITERVIMIMMTTEQVMITTTIAMMDLIT